MARSTMTALFSRNIPGGINVVADLLETGTGNIYWVDSVNGASTNSGTAPTDALVTWDAAINKCTANQGDLIVLMENHQEDITAAGGVDLDVAGVRTIGLGDGAQMPEIKLTTATTADIDIDAADITIENVHFKSGYADIAVCLDVNATDFTVRNCKFTEDDDDENFLVCVQDAAGATSDRITIEGCYAIQDDASNTHFVNFGGTGKGHIVRNNVLMGDWGTMAVGGAGVITFALIANNLILNAATTDDACISMAATATGIAANNRVGAPATSGQANHILAPDFAVLENYASLTASEDLSGILDPAAT